MPATSQQQQKLMGIVHALQKGDIKPSKVSAKAKELAKSMKPSDVTKFAGTKHKGLPKKIKKENMGVASMYVVQKPYAGCELTSLVKPIDPLVGIGAGHEITPDQVYGVYADQDQATNIANELYEAYCKQEEILEEKKAKVGNKIKKTIDHLEKKRKEHLDMAKEDPKSAVKHKERIAKIASQIDDLMSKMEKIEKSKKNVEKKEDKKKDIKESIVSERREYDQEEMEKLGFNLYPGGRTEAWEFATEELGISPAEILGKMSDDDVYNAIDSSLEILGYYNNEDEDLYEGKNWSKMMAGVRKGSQSGPWTIVVSRNKKVVYQKQVKIKDAIPANFEDLKNTSGLNGDIFAIEDNEGMIVYYEKIQK
jgi:hypothetical protein